MKFRFHLQDPTHEGTTYLYEAVLEAAVDAVSWRGVYAFASRGGVDRLVEDPVVVEFFERGGRADLLIGLDAVTNRQTLERLQELKRENRNFKPRVFWNDGNGLFHPKLSDFSYRDGRRTLIVGSGNLTPGGLMMNYEGYVDVTAGPRERLDVSALDEFLERHADDIREIDLAALKRAARNLVPQFRKASRRRTVDSANQKPATSASDRVLIAQVPRAGDRWAQVHFNKEVVEKFFRISDAKVQRVFLTEVENSGRRKDVEARPCVFSTRNRNHRIEIGAANGRKPYPVSPPLVVFKERQLRVFDYLLLVPGKPGYRKLDALARQLPSTGRGHRRVMTSMGRLGEAWPKCPLLKVKENGEPGL